ncbi:metallophosphoesterase family protein [Methylocapsa palsarum]|uniref:3',5'-cyclic AMP phosphodiesterase CpdA n=1 Tax=Methylocapsa palsarum TaxID=1612308 RepID=A0A1I3Z7G5_9HYPH|nr:metallophosphoesterase [Methylocapsa palsarum]SFK40002.1 3',5'-cyclic AMP phosphodiesterase CpdA [Methylocapsa palsarum]
MSFILAHLTDPHIGPLPKPRRRDLIGKRVTGYLNWTSGRRLVHDMDALRQVVADVKAHHPHHIAVTGDISNIGLPAEFQLAGSWLETLGPCENVSFVPGNHDAYVRGSMRHLARAFAPWTRGEPARLDLEGEAAKPGLKADDGQPVEGYPYMKVRGNVALIGLSSGVPTPFFIASGLLGRPQIEACEALLIDARQRGLVRIVMIHHPPQSAAAGAARGLRDARAFEALIRRAGAELIIHGHSHRRSVAHMRGPDGLVPVVSAPSASAIRGAPRHRAGYLLYEVTGNASNFKIEARARGLLPGSSTIGDLGPIRL